jgi:hypothetical protein
MLTLRQAHKMKRQRNGLFTKGEHPSPEMRAKMTEGVIRHWKTRKRYGEKAAMEQARADRNLELVRKQLAQIRGGFCKPSMET